MKIPEHGLGEEHIFQQLSSYQTLDLNWRSGKIMGYVYDAGKAAEAVGKKAYMMFLMENALDPTVYQSLLKLENELVAMGAAHVGGDEAVAGNFTSGGTESILLAVKTARDYFREHRPDITVPEMILPMTAHAAFFKAAAYFDVKPVQVDVDPVSFKADPDQIKHAINKNTILLVASAPSYAHGVVDPIPEIAKLAVENDILFHVDACVGGFMLPYFRRLGVEFPEFGFNVPGVTSLSMDLHKYGYTPKNASMVLYRDKQLRKYQMFACAKWPGYTVINTAIQSSKTGGPMAAAWAVLNFIGDNGYLEIARRKLAATKKMLDGIEAINGLRVTAKPDMCMFSVISDSVNVFHIIDEMKKRGWYIQPQLEFKTSQKNFHISVNAANVDLVDEFLSDLAASTEAAADCKISDIVGEIEKLLTGTSMEEIKDDDLSALMDMVGIQGSDFPESMAEINDILNILPPDFRERLLVFFLNELFKQPGTNEE